MKNSKSCIIIIAIIGVIWAAVAVLTYKSYHHRKPYHGAHYTWSQTQIADSEWAADPCVAVGPADEVYAAYDQQGVFRSIDGGKNWTLRRNGMKNCRINALAVDSKCAVYAGTGCGVYKSTDKAEYWKLVNTGLPPESVRAIAVDSKDWVYAGTDSRHVFKTKDGGQHWKQIRRGKATNGAICSICVTDKGSIFLGTYYGGVFRSNDGGSHWEKLNFKPESPLVRSIIVSPNKEIVAANGSVVKFRNEVHDNCTKSHIGWTVEAFRRERIRCSSVAFAPDGSLIAGTHSGVFGSADNGATWENLNLHIKVLGVMSTAVTPKIYCVAVDSQGRVYAADCHGKMFVGIPARQSSKQ